MGGVVKKEQLIVSQSVGQSSVVNKFSSGNINLNQGFQQSIYFAEQLVSSTINVYPNPTTNDFSILLNSKPAAPTIIHLYDSQGRICYTKEYSPQRLINVQLSQVLSPGIYLLKVKVENQLITQQLIIQ